MRVLDLLHAPWAIRPEVLQTMLEIYERHARGESYDRAAVEAALGRPLKNEPKPYQVREGVAVINVLGVLAKRMDLFTEISGGASMQRLQQDVATAVDDPSVHSILLAIDSPGGDVDGTQALATDVYNARKRKKVVALADGVMGSGAYWIGSAAERVFITGDTTVVGSIGVVTAHTDVSRAQEMRGVKTTEITAGKYKRIASPYAPLSAEGRETLQGIVDHIYSVFVDDVARNRGTDAETVLKDMADGRLFLGKQAVKAGLVDGVTTLEALIASLNEEQMHAARVTGAITVAPDLNDGGTTVAEEKKPLTAEEVKALETAAHERGKAEGATAERERIKAVEAQAMPGHEALIAEMKFDGKTTGPEAAVRVISAEREAKKKVGTDLRSDAPNPAPATTTTGAETGTKAEPEPQEIADKAKAYQIEQKAKGKDVTTAEAVRHTRSQMGLKD